MPPGVSGSRPEGLGLADGATPANDAAASAVFVARAEPAALSVAAGAALPCDVSARVAMAVVTESAHV